MIHPAAIVVLVFALILGAIYEPLDSNSQFATQEALEKAVVSKNILLVTAHPDDESLFFAPTILALQQKSVNETISFSHLCLSYGNAEGLGETRKRELSHSLDILGVSTRWVVDHPKLQDNQTAEWDPNVIAEVLKPYVHDHKIDTILTFDASGVSNHPNHNSIPAGVLSLIKNLGVTSSEPPLRLFTLISSSLPYKYISVVSVPLSKIEIIIYRGMQKLEAFIIQVLSIWHPDILTPPYPRNPDANATPIFISGYKEYKTALESMKAHMSQLLWFRYLYVAFSRYMWINAYVEIKP
uniref:N-acetylglucosaminylphosphatidylinositol deacetylase n=1 Tax=Psilocybe cubensis TaxID=181762 RepID=A0A8H8CJY9_PSICU